MENFINSTQQRLVPLLVETGSLDYGPDPYLGFLLGKDRKPGNTAGTLTLSAGQRVQFSNRWIGGIETVDNREIADAWRFRHLRVRKRPLPEVLDELSRYRTGLIYYERAYEQDKQQWVKHMQELLNDIRDDVRQQGGSLPDEKKNPKQRRRTIRSKARNLLERLKLYKKDVLWFMANPIVPFINNQGENDLRTTKVHQKISGCFQSKNGADIFCRVRSFLLTCKRKNTFSASDALTLLFAGKLPDFL